MVLKIWCKIYIIFYICKFLKVKLLEVASLSFVIYHLSFSEAKQALLRADSNIDAKLLFDVVHDKGAFNAA